MVEAAREDPGILQVIAGLPEQGLNAVCTTPQNDPQAREAIGRTSRTCRISLYGETSQVEAEYLIFMDYRKYSIWETVRNRMEYPIRDAYMDVSSLEVASPHRALRVGPEGNDPRETAGTSPALRLTGLEKKR